MKESSEMNTDSHILLRYCCDGCHVRELENKHVNETSVFKEINMGHINKLRWQHEATALVLKSKNLGGRAFLVEIFRLAFYYGLLSLSYNLGK